MLAPRRQTCEALAFPIAPVRWWHAEEYQPDQWRARLVTVEPFATVQAHTSVGDIIDVCDEIGRNDHRGPPVYLWPHPSQGYEAGWL